MPSKTQTIEWSPFTKKHADYIEAALESKFSIAEGAIRSGKTIDHCIIAAAYLECCPDRLHLATGSSVRNAKLNIGDCNGYGLEFLFRGRCRWGQYKANEALIIQTQTGEKVVVFSGGGSSDSYRGILGNSYGLWIATEVNEHYLNFDDPKISFVHVAIGRQIAAKRPMRLWDLNPSNPGHRIYTDFIDLYREQGKCNYQHFTLHDNGSLSPERIEEIEADYIPGSLWHTRDILGQRCVAEGLIYRYFAEHKAEYLVAEADLPPFKEIVVAADWGGNKSKHSFTAVGIPFREDAVYALCSETHEATDTDADFVSSKFNLFVDRVQSIYGRVTDAYGDSADQVLINTVSNKGKVRLRDSIKNPIKDRIDAQMLLIARRKFGYTRDCETLVNALCTAQWDVKHPDVRLDDGTSDIDSLDSYEYSWERWLPYILRK